MAADARPAEKLIFIDRDGVINVDPIGDYIKSWEDFRFETGALDGLKQLSDAGFAIVIISNQAGVGDGVYPEAKLWEIHRNMMNSLEKQGIRIRGAHYCLHGKEAGCACRKPRTGLFEAAVKGITYNPAQTFFIGDKSTDIEAGKKFGLRTIFVRTGHGTHDEPELARKNLLPDFRAENLKEAAEIVLRHA